jgi:hypothetical protein
MTLKTKPKAEEIPRQWQALVSRPLSPCPLLPSLAPHPWPLAVSLCLSLSLFVVQGPREEVLWSYG